MPQVPLGLQKNVYCQRCNKLLNNRAAGTKWCMDCSKIVSRENAHAKLELTKKLLIRDTAKAPFPLNTATAACKVCDAKIKLTDNFCYRCGQRLLGGYYE